MLILDCIYFVWFLSFCTGDQGKVFGGRFARRGEFPSTVAVIGKVLCGGTVATLDKVLTAGHCLVDKKTKSPVSEKTLTIFGGTLKIPLPPNFIVGEDAQERKVAKFKIHEGFKPKKDGSSYHDIALIILTEPFEQTTTLSTAKFPSKNPKEFLDAWKELASSKKNCVGVGWGTTVYQKRKNGSSVADVPSEDLKTINMTPLDQKTCSSYVWKADEDMTDKGEVCVSSDTAKGESVCKGDGGNPLYCDGYVFALAIATAGCGSKIKRQYYLLYGPYFDYFGLLIDLSLNGDPQNHGSFLYTNERFLLIMSSVLILHNKIYKF